MHRWTPEQELAINTRGGDLLVSAAAGTGKTAVLVDRAIRLITADGVDCDRLLVVTFTNAAAAEMKNRLRQALSEQISLNPSASRLRSQLAILDRAFIGTIHSFCLNLIKQHFYLAELDPRFRVASEEETALLRAAAVEELFERRYDEGAAGFAALLDCYGGERGWRALQELVLTLYTYAQNSPDPQGWLRAAAGRFFLPGDAALEAQPWFADLKKHIALTLQAARELLREGIALAARPDGPAAYLDVFRADLALLERLASSCAGTWEEMTGAFAQAEFPRLKALRRDTGEDLKEQAKNCREATKRKISGLREELFSRSASQYLDELRRCAPLLQELVALALDFGEIYRQVKNSHGAVDFSDLEHLALKILTASDTGPNHLTPSEVARQLQNYFAEVLVDEYQDINPVQEAILSLVARNNLFMVGDAKQSIYRFRLTEPGIFLAKYQGYAPVGTPSRQRKVSLVRNFRCRENLVDAVNRLFRRIMTPGVGEIDYEELVYGASYPPLPGAGHAADHLAELHLLEKSALENGAKNPPDGEPAGEESEADGLFDPEGPEELEAAQREARLIARQIIELVHGDPPLFVWDGEACAYRPATYRDVVVLMRSAINDAPVFLEEFTRMGVPAWTDAGAGYFAATEIETMLSLLKIIANPRQDIPLAGVLRSPLVGLTLDELARIRLCRPAGDFYDAVLAAAAPGTEGEEQKLNAFLRQLDRWRTISRQKPLALLIWDIYRQTGYYDFVGGLPGGRERQANLRALFNRACQYENTSFRGLSGFLQFIDRLRESGRDLGPAGALGESENVVRIMSIHKSKGLEFPVVFIAGLGKQFNFRDLQKNILLHKDLGLGPQFVDQKTRVSYPTLPKIAVRTRLKLEMLAEEMRILYVALTRAREKLVLVGTVRDLPQALPKWRRAAPAAGRALSDACLAGARTYLDWLCPALLGFNRDAEPQNGFQNSYWRIRLWNSEELLKLAELPQTAGNQELLAKVKRFEPVETGREFAGLVARRLDWRYPYAGVDRPAKLTATEAKRFFDLLPHEEDPSLPMPGAPEPAALTLLRPKFLQTHRELSPAERGQALHRVMQHLDFEKTGTETEIKEQIAALLDNELLTREQAAAVDVREISRFCRTPLGKRCRRARAVNREVPFTLALSAGEIYPELAGTKETVLVQGMIDLLFEEEDGLVIVDFKTDYLRPGDGEALDRLAQRYRRQVALYARAVKTILERPVKAGYLYFFATGDIVRVFP